MAKQGKITPPIGGDGAAQALAALLPERFRELCRRLQESEDLRAGMEAVAWSCDGVFPFYRVALVLPRRKGRLFVAAAWARRPEEELQGYDFDLSGHPLEQVIRNGRLLVRTDPLGDQPDGPLLRLYREENKAEEVAVPLEVGGPRGLLIFASREHGSFSEEVCRWVEDVGRVVALWARPWVGRGAPYLLKEQYQALLDGALDGIAVLAGETLAYANPSFREIFGLSRGSASLEAVLIRLTPSSRREFLAGLDRLEGQGRMLPRLEVEADSGHGSPLHLEIGLQGVVYLGEPAVLIQAHNATERVEREHQVRESFNRTDGLLHTLAHDIRGPLTTILGFSELLERPQEGLPPERRGEALGVIARSSRALKALVEGLLDYSSVSHDPAPLLEVKTVSILDLVEAELEGLVRETGARIDYRRIPPTLRGRPGELSRVFRNLIENGIKYARPGVPPVVRVSGIGQEGQFQVLSVEDNGMGIDPRRQTGVFDLFARGSGGGAGVGLAIVDRVVRAYGGRTWLESAVGEGSRFFFTLPCGVEARPPEGDGG